MKLLESDIYIKDLKKAINRIDLSVLKGKTIFITGGLGLIGSAIIDALLVYGDVTVYVGARNEQQFIKRYGELNSVKYIYYDALSNFNLPVTPDYIIHGASLASPELYTTMPVETLLTNFNGIHTLLEYTKNKNHCRLLYISSSEVYGKKRTDDSYEEGNYGEVNIDNIRSSYAISKRASEMLCKAYALEYGVDTIIVRPGHIYGPSAKRSDKRVSSSFAYKAADGENLEMKSSGLQKRSYCYSIDCAIQILTALIKGKSGEAYNVGHDEVTTIKKMAEIYAKAGNVALSVANPTSSELKDFNPMSNATLNNNKIKNLGYKDTFTVEEGLCHTVAILKEINK